MLICISECTMPIEYCEYSGQLDKCRQWLNINLPELVDQLNLGVLDASQDEKKHQVFKYWLYLSYIP